VGATAPEPARGAAGVGKVLASKEEEVLGAAGAGA